MFIQSLEKDISHIVHNNVTYKVVKGIANVPQEVRDELTKFPNWHDLVEAIDEETLKFLEVENEKHETGGEVKDPPGETGGQTDGEGEVSDGDNGSDDQDQLGENADKGPTLPELREQAKGLGIQAVSRMKKEELISAIEEASKQTSQE